MKSRTPLILFALLGLGASLTSTYVHYNLLVDRSFSSFCDVNATVSCTQAYLSPYGTFMGVPVALAGVFFFAVVLALAALSGRKTPQAGESAPAYIFALSTIGLAFGFGAPAGTTMSCSSSRAPGLPVLAILSSSRVTSKL